VSHLSHVASPAAIRIAALAGSLLAVPAAWALDQGAGEEAAITDCDKRLCAILVGKNAKGPDLKCSLTKTWARSSIKQADTQKVTWGFGDARCTIEINLSRADLVAVMTGEHRTFHMPPHTAHCVVEQNGKLEKVTAVVAPKIKFKHGKADQIWINLKSIEGPSSITFTVQSAAQLEDTLGIFHRHMIKTVNKYIERHCPSTLEEVTAKAAPSAKSKAK
jgi:hypothetical protein